MVQLGYSIIILLALFTDINNDADPFVLMLF